MKNIVLVSIVLIFAIVLSSCATPTPPPPPPPTNTPIPPPTNTPLPTSTPEPTSTPDPYLFRDEFEGALKPEWSWMNEDNTKWSLTNNPGWLEIVAGPGGIPDGHMKNVLMQTAPQGNFEIETRLKFKPEGNFQIGGLVMYQDNGNLTIFGRAFCGGCPPKDGYYFDLYVDGQWGGENFATKAPDGDTVYLRLRRDGNQYTGFASEDGMDWLIIGTHTSEMNPGLIGLAAGQAVNSDPKPAQFDYFTVKALP